MAEYYRDYSPPVDVNEAVHELLLHVPEKHLTGLHGITLTNSQSTRRLRKGKTWTRNKKVRLADCRGLYRDGQIVLLIDKIFLDLPTWLLRLRFFRTYMIGEVLYHEIGHHVQEKTKLDRRDKEFVADEWSNKLLTSFMRKTYWYISIVAIPVKLLRRPLLLLFKRKKKNPQRET